MEKKQSCAILCILRTSRKIKEDVYPIFLRITVDGKRSEIATKFSCSKEKWNSSKGRIKGTTDQTKRMNLSLDSFELRAKEIHSKFLLSGEFYSSEKIKREIDGTQKQNPSVLNVFEDFIKRIESRVGIDYTLGTIKNWHVTLRHFKQFLKEHYHISDTSFKQVNFRFINNFEWFAKTTWKCHTNATLKHLERFRKIIRLAINSGWIEKDPFVNFKFKKAKTLRTFLTDEELCRIESKNLRIERLAKVRDIFVFSCYTGLAYVDIERLTSTNVVTGIDNKQWIYTFRKKTNNKSNVPLLPKALQILHRYQTEKTSSSKLLPVISNIKTNAYLKEIADLCSIEKNLTFHMARHTFATTIALSNGVPIETVSNILGHSKITTTQIYAKVLENKVSKDMNDLESKLATLGQNSVS